MTETEDLSEDKVVRHPESAAFISVGDVNNLYCVCQNRYTLRLEKTQNDNFVRSSFDPQDGISGTIKRLDFSVYAAVELFVSLKGDSEVGP